ncbi:reverse transcriptase domain-containing protein [Tanacetum coccineum]
MTRSRLSRTSSSDPSRIRSRSPSRDRPNTKITSAILKSRTMVSTPPKGLRPSTEDPLKTDVDPGARGDRGKANLYHPADLKAALVTRAIRSQEIKGARRWKKTWPYLGAARIDLEDHLKVFQASAQVERWAMPTWCHMFNSTLIGAARVWFDELPLKIIDSYKDLKATFLAYFMQRKKHVKDLVEIHNIKQRDGETIEEFM